MAKEKADKPLVHYVHVDTESGELITIDVSHNASPTMLQQAVNYLLRLLNQANDVDSKLR